MLVDQLTERSTIGISCMQAGLKMLGDFPLRSRKGLNGQCALVISNPYGQVRGAQ